MAYEALIGGVVPEGGEKTTVDKAVSVVQKRYGQSPVETDEFLKPIVFGGEGRIKGLSWRVCRDHKKYLLILFLVD